LQPATWPAGSGVAEGVGDACCCCCCCCCWWWWQAAAAAVLVLVEPVLVLEPRAGRRAGPRSQPQHCRRRPTPRRLVAGGGLMGNHKLEGETTVEWSGRWLFCRKQTWCWCWSWSWSWSWCWRFRRCCNQTSSRPQRPLRAPLLQHLPR
jgi:hypothetical protein